MSKAGRRYSLVVYTHMINRWYPAMLALGVAMFGLAWVARSWGFDQWRWMALAGVAAMFILVGILLFAFRKSASIRMYGDHFRLSTPFLRLNVSYKRILKTSTANMGVLFPRNNVSNWMSDIIQPLAKMNAIVIEFRSMPMSQNALRFFLSPLFFKDKSPHIVILVDDWMKFSADLESARVGGGTSSTTGRSSGPSGGAGQAPQPQKRNTSSILSKLPKQ